MKKIVIPLVLIFLFFLSGCTNQSVDESYNQENTNMGTSLEDWCEVGTHGVSAGSNFTVIGFETHEVGNKSMKLCCTVYEIINQEEIGKFKQKMCNDENDNNFINFYYNYSSKNWYKVSEGFIRGDQSCSRMYDENVNILFETCD